MVENKVYDWKELGASHHFCLDAVPDNSRVLEFGTATGYMTRILKEEKGCRVTGFEYSPEAAERAAPYCDRVIVGDIEDFSLWEGLEPVYNRATFADVLEHLRDPVRVLAQTRHILAPNGSVIITLPNIAHWTIRRDLLRGRFDYADYGIMDKTHLRFFTEKTFRAMIAEANFTIDVLDYTEQPYPLEYFFYRFHMGRLKRVLNRAVKKRWHDAMAFQWMAQCHPNPL